MHLLELTGIKKQMENSTLQQFLNNLKKNNKISIHNGKFSIVLVPPSGSMVYKLWSQDSAYEHYVNICQSNSKPFLPKVGKKIYSIPNGFIRRSDITSSIKIVTIENLKPIDEKWNNRATFDRIFYPLHKCLSSKKSYQHLIDIVANEDAKFAKFLVESIEFLKQYIPAEDINFDIHAGNIMMRGDEYVMADPFISSEDHNNPQKLPASMDTSHFLDADIDYGSDTYVSGKKKTTVLVSKKIAASNPKVWANSDLIEQYHLTAKDFPNELNNIENINSLIMLYGKKLEILPKPLVDIVVTYRQCITTYLNYNNAGSDLYFYNKLFENPLFDKKPNLLEILLKKSQKLCTEDEYIHVCDLVTDYICNDFFIFIEDDPSLFVAIAKLFSTTGLHTLVDTITHQTQKDPYKWENIAYSDNVDGLPDALHDLFYTLRTYS
jgi:hypothetical protein